MGKFLITVEVVDESNNSAGIFSIEIQAENREAARAALLKHNPRGQIYFCNIQITAVEEEPDLSTMAGRKAKWLAMGGE